MKKKVVEKKVLHVLIDGGLKQRFAAVCALTGRKQCEVVEEVLEVWNKKQGVLKDG